MATLVKTIKSRSTDDIIYPVTKADAVYFNDNNNLVSVQGKINTIQGLLGSSSISNVGSSITGIIGNEALTTTAQTLAGAINEHQTDIFTLNNTLTFSIFSSANYKATSTNLENVGCSITVPEGKYAIVQCIAWFGSGAPVAVALTNNTSTPGESNTRFYQEFVTGFRMGFCNATILEPGVFYMWVKRSSVPNGTNNHQIRGWLL